MQELIENLDAAVKNGTRVVLDYEDAVKILAFIKNTTEKEVVVDEEPAQEIEETENTEIVETESIDAILFE